MPEPVAIFANPTTATCYRLVSEASGWRISKSRTDAGTLRLSHLRGHHGSDAVDATIIARFVAGHGGVVPGNVDPATLFAAVVILDLEHTASVLTAIAREAEHVYHSGCRGFRPRSPLLRKQRDDAMARAVSDMQAMAAAWRGSRLQVSCNVPGWLAAALEDGM